jgi:hypothetical protein
MAALHLVVDELLTAQRALLQWRRKGEGTSGSR